MTNGPSGRRGRWRHHPGRTFASHRLRRGLSWRSRRSGERVADLTLSPVASFFKSGDRGVHHALLNDLQAFSLQTLLLFSRNRSAGLRRR
jgi:hypothetical protein